MDKRNQQKNIGLYDPRYEHDACGVGFIANLNGEQSHWIVRKGIEILENLEHRGAVGAEKNSGDGAGILVQMPHQFLKKECSSIGITLPEFSEYGAGIIFLPKKKDSREKIKEIFENCVKELGQEVLGWRDLPVNNSGLGKMVRDVEPHMAQVFIKKSNDLDPMGFERRLFVIRKYAKKKVLNSGIEGSLDYFISSLSYKTIAYKGMLTSPQVMEYFRDLSDETFTSALALVHSRFSTNTFPSWPLGQPFRYLAHNGEINTLRGNINRMAAREAVFKSDVFTDDELEKLKPIIDDTQSDSAIIDNAVELLVMNGRSLPHVMMMLIPEAWAHDKEMSPKKRAFYEYHATMMEPWDGPASIAFTDGKVIGATLDRNGLRPSRYLLTDDNILVMGSEAGVLEFPPEKIVLNGRLQPGRMFVASLEEHRIIPDEEIKELMADTAPYSTWLAEGKLELRQLEKVRSPHQPDHNTLVRRQSVFGNTLEDIRMILLPMANNGSEPIGSMGNDTPLAVLSDKPQLLFNYFYQLFAQVTNPPIDSIREESVMSLVSFIGAQGQILTEAKEHCRVIELPHPILTNHQLERLKQVNIPFFHAEPIPIVFRAEGGNHNLEKAIDEVCRKATDAVAKGKNILILSDRTVNDKYAPIPTLLAVSAVHYHLIRNGVRTRCSIIVESGEAREVHHFATLLGYGASAINPYLALETIEDLRLNEQLEPGITRKMARDNYMKAIDKGLLKILSKMGISTIQSYIGAQIFEAVGLKKEFIDKYFSGTASRLGGVGIDIIETESLMRHRYAYPRKDEVGSIRLEHGGKYSWRARGEHHSFNPETIHLLQQSTRMNDFGMFKKYTETMNNHTIQLNTIRGLLEFANNEPIPVEEVEPVESIVKRFFTGAMSFGSISKEAHETIAIAMNRLGAKSNTGEGGEDPARFTPLPNGDSARSAIKQVASGRFGVTSHYLVNSDEIQIKMAQGAKPGEGGQLPGHKVDKVIAKTRNSTPGVGLISPPPHHDIYSIEDLAQLIFDLKNSNIKARINVKLVSEIGVGTIAAGVAKGHAEAVLISGHDGGTGASPQSSIKHAGLPWELGLAETHQVLMRNDLRSRIVVQTDGRILTGYDVAVATLLGAEEWGAATSALIVSGCVMMRKCHMNSCPVGIATQDKDLRAFFTGKPEYLVNYFTFLATEMRNHMAQLGFRTVNEMVGRVDKLKMRSNVSHWKAKHMNLDNLLHKAKSPSCASYCVEEQDFGLENALDHQLIEMAKPALEKGEKVKGEIKIRNINRTIGTMLSAEISRRYGAAGLPDDTIYIKANGSAGQSFSAFGAKGVTFEIEGEVNDYFCKGLSGSKVILYPPKNSTFNAHENVIVGNVALYGATNGEVYIRGIAGERFCVRNSGAKVVVEAVGDHGCEYMTGGRVIILGSIGKNFGAGMSGGIAYILETDGMSKKRINPEMVDLERLSDPAEIEEVKGMIERHHNFTGSNTSRKVLAKWNSSVAKFIKVMPKDYKRALAEMAEEKELIKTMAG
ncbi:MAG: glutamate synthase large subunit [Nitrospinota bacterium]|nr:glutamate synthase large subunit [Nitrospinota bacterium]